MRAITLTLVVAMLAGCQSRPSRAPESHALVRCEGRFERFEKDGFQGFVIDRGCEYLDVTSVIITSPEAFRNRRHYLYSVPGSTASVGKRGDAIAFEASPDQLEGDLEVNPRLLKSLEKPNQSSEPTPTSGTSAAEQPRVPAAVVAVMRRA